MIVMMFVVLTIRAEGKILLPVVGDDAVDNTIGTKTIQDTVNRCPVYAVGNKLADAVVAQGNVRFLEGGKDGGFRRGITTLHQGQNFFCDFIALIIATHLQ